MIAWRQAQPIPDDRFSVAVASARKHKKIVKSKSSSEISMTIWKSHIGRKGLISNSQEIFFEPKLFQLESNWNISPISFLKVLGIILWDLNLYTVHRIKCHLGAPKIGQTLDLFLSIQLVCCESERLFFFYLCNDELDLSLDTDLSFFFKWGIYCRALDKTPAVRINQFSR